MFTYMCAYVSPMGFQLAYLFDLKVNVKVVHISNVNISLTVKDG